MRNFEEFIFNPPLALASGTWGLGDNLFKYYTKQEIENTFGALITKGISLKPRKGNPPPRIWETPCGFINSIGIENPGIKEFKKNFLKKLLTLNTEIFVNLYGETIEEFCLLAEELKSENIAGIELNISCPNVEKGGISFAFQPELIKALILEIKKIWDKKLWVKLSPVGFVFDIAKICEDLEVDAIVIANTYPGLVVIEKNKILKGGVSGPAIKPLTLRLVYEISKKFSIPIIGCGGIMNAKDVEDYFLCGAKGVQIGTAFLVDPEIPKKIIKELEKKWGM